MQALQNISGSLKNFARPTVMPSLPTPTRLVDNVSLSGTVGKITLKEAASIGGAAALGAGLTALGAVAVTTLGAAAGIPAAIVGEGILGVIAGRVLTWGAHDGSAVGGMMMVGGIAGALGGGVGAATCAIAGALAGAAGGGAILAGAAAGALAAGGFATWLALNN